MKYLNQVILNTHIGKLMIDMLKGCFKMKDMILNKNNILDVAEQVIKKFGVTKAGISDVARFFKVSHAAIYRYYENKKALWDAVTERWLDTTSKPLLEILENDGSSIDKLKAWLFKLFEAKKISAETDPEMFEIYATLVQQSGSVLENHMIELKKQVSTILLEGIKKSEIKAIEIERTASCNYHGNRSFPSPVFCL